MRTASRWLLMAAAALALLAVTFGVWLTQASNRIVGYDTRRNSHDLALIASTLESWPTTVESMARANLLPTRLEPATMADRGRGWQAQARFWHPSLGQLHIRYALAATPAACPQADAAKGRQSWIRAGMMRLAGNIPVASLDAADRHIVPGLASFASLRIGGEPLFPGNGAIACYATELPLGRLVGLGDVAPTATHLIIADAGTGEVRAQIADDPLALTNLKRLPVTDSLSASVLDRLSGAKAVAVDPLTTLDPVRVQAAGESHVAYVRPLTLPGAGEGGGAVAVMLVPAGMGATRLLHPPPIIAAGFGVALLILLALVPVLKLRFLGPAEALSVLELTAVGAGTVIVIAVAISAALFSVDVELSRIRAEVRTANTALALREQFRGEIGRLIGAERRRGPFGAPRPVTCMDAPLSLNAVMTPPPGQYPLIEPDVAALPANLRQRFESGALPPRESAFLVDTTGTLVPGTAIASCRMNNGARLDIVERDYFQAALAGDTLRVPGMKPVRLLPRGAQPGAIVLPRYSIAEVRSQSDGIDKTIIAFPVLLGGSTLSRAPTGVLATASVLRSLLSPMLPPDERFMVVDLASPTLKVLFHSTRARAGVENVEDEITAPGLAGARQNLSRPEFDSGRPGSFTATYDGQRQHFAYTRLPYSNWGLFVWHAHDSADLRPARMLQDTLVGWLTAAAILSVLTTLLLMVTLPHPWRWLWPDEARRDQYRIATRANLAAAATGLVTLVVVPDWPILAALLCWLAIVIIGYCCFLEPAPATSPLLPETQSCYRYWAVSLVLVAVVVPVLAFHRDAAVFAQRADDASSLAYEKTALAARANARAAIARVYFTDLRAANVGRAGAGDDGLGVAGDCWRPRQSWASRSSLIERATAALRPETSASPVLASDLPAQSQRCFGAKALPAGGLATDTAVSRADPKLSLGDTGLMPVLWVLITIAAGLAASGFALGVVWTRLFGLGTPLEAVRYPSLPVPASFADLALGQRTLVVKPPLWLETSLIANAHHVDLTDETPSPVPGMQVAPWSPPQRYVVTGIELVLRDPPRRRAALALLEKLVSSAAFRAGNVQLVVLSELMPLEPLLQAFEREKETLARGDDALAYEAVRRHLEDTRWARLFEGVQVFVFPIIPKLLPSAGDSTVVAATVAELAPLPERVLAALLPPPTLAPLSPELRAAAANEAAAFDSYYGNAVRRYADSLHAPSLAAAVDFAGTILIDHYQQLWSASSRGEQLVLHNLASGRVPSVSSAGPLKSLIRRGLVVFDPLPRLMNDSFGNFLRRVERPATLARWRRDAPSGGWQLAVWPLIIILPLGLLALGWGIVDSGQPLAALLPLLLAGGPALLQALGVARKMGGR